MRPSLFCKVCNQDHSKPLAMPKWCDRSELEIKYDQVWDEYIKLTKALDIAESALKEIQTRTAHMQSKHAGKLNRYTTEALEQIKKIKNGQ